MTNPLDFSRIRTLLNRIAEGSGPTESRTDDALLRALVDHGLVDDGSPGSLRLTADGSDMLDVMRDRTALALVEQRARQLGPFSLSTVKAAIAERISGGFNA